MKENTVEDFELTQKSMIEGAEADSVVVVSPLAYQFY